MDLNRDDSDRDAWKCPRCEATALGVGDLIDDLLEVAPHLRPVTGVRELVTISRRASETVTCPACRQAMEPVYLAGLEVERCRDDQLLWLQDGERAWIVARAASQPQSQPFDHLRVVFLGTETPAPTPTRPSGLSTFVAILALLASTATFYFFGDFAGTGFLLVASLLSIVGVVTIVRAIR